MTDHKTATAELRQAEKTLEAAGKKTEAALAKLREAQLEKARALLVRDAAKANPALYDEDALLQLVAEPGTVVRGFDDRVKAKIAETPVLPLDALPSEERAFAEEAQRAASSLLAAVAAPSQDTGPADPWDVPAAPSAEPEKPKRTRRTKAQMEAARAAEAVQAPAPAPVEPPAHEAEDDAVDGDAAPAPSFNPLQNPF